MENFTLEFENARALQAVYGGDEKLLRELESRLSVRITARDGWLRVEGSADGLRQARAVLAQLQDAVRRGVTIKRHEFLYALNAVLGETAGGERSLGGLVESRIQCSAKKPPIVPKTPGQKAYLQAIQSNDITFGVGPAGTGKTYLAVALAVAALKQDKVSRIVLTRPAVEAGERLGFLPGDLAQKVDPYLRPLYDALYDLMGFDKVAKLFERGAIEIAPLAYMRGRTLNHAFIILDEAQNTTPEQMKMFLTRIGIGAKAVVTGDVTQIDLQRGQKSGLIEARQILRDVRGIAFTEFQKEDVVRHPLVARIVSAYEAHTASLEGK